MADTNFYPNRYSSVQRVGIWAALTTLLVLFPSIVFGANVDRAELRATNDLIRAHMAQSNAFFLTTNKVTGSAVQQNGNGTITIDSTSGITLNQATNVAQYFATNSAIITSNAVLNAGGIVFTNIAEMRASSATNRLAFVRSYWGTNDDLGGGVFDLVPTNGYATNLGTVFASADAAKFWVRRIDGDVFAQWFGVQATGDGTTNSLPLAARNTQRLYDLNRYLTNSPRRQIVHFPPGILPVTNHLWMLGVQSAVLDFSGVTGQQLGNTNIPFLVVGGDPGVDSVIGTGTTRAYLLPDFIDSVSSGSTNIVLKNASDTNRYSAGMWVRVTGYEQQGNGFPINFRFNDYAKVLAVVPSTRTLVLDRPLKHEYRDDWFAMDYGCCWESSSASNIVGPAGVMPLLRSNYFRFSESMELLNLTTIPNPLEYPSTNASYPNVTWFNSSAVWASGANVFKAKNLKTSLVYVGSGGTFRYEDCQVDYFEPDKQATALEIERCHFGVMVEGTGFESISVHNSIFESAVGLYPRRLISQGNTFKASVGTAPLQWNQTSGEWRDNQFYVSSPHQEIFRGISTESGSTYHDAPGPGAITISNVTATNFTTDATIGNFIFRINADIGTVLKNGEGKKVAITRITFATNTTETNFVVAYTNMGGLNLTNGDRLYFYFAQSLFAAHNMRVNGSQNVPQSQGFEPAETYINTDDGVTSRTLDVTWSELDPNPAAQYQNIDGFLSLIEVNVERAYTGVGDPSLRLELIDPYGLSGTYASFDTSVTGRRMLTTRGIEGARPSDSVIPQLGNEYVKRFQIFLAGTDNSGSSGFKGYVRFIATKRANTTPTTNLLIAINRTSNAVSINTNGAAGTLNLHGTFYANGLGSNATVSSFIARQSDGKLVETAAPAGTGGSATNAIAEIYSNNVAVATGATQLGTTNSGNVQLQWNVYSSRPTMSANVASGVTNGLDSRATSLESQTNSLGARATSLESQTNSLGARATSLESQTNSLGTRLTARETADATQTNNINTVSNRVTTIEGMTNAFLTTNKVTGTAVTQNGDGTVTIDSTGGSGSTETNAWRWQGFDTNQSLNWAFVGNNSGTNWITVQPSNSTTFAFANTPSAGGAPREMRLFVYWTNGAGTSITWPIGVDWRGTQPGVLANTTNLFGFTFDGTNIYGWAEQTTNIYQPTNAALTFLANNPTLTNSLVAGWAMALTTNSGVVTVTPTNYPASIATNATSVTVGFSDTENVQIYNAWFHLTTNLVVSPTNLVVGRTICVRFATNSLTYDVVVTNTAATPVRWNFNVATNGSTSFTKTNSLSARLYLTAETNGVISAEMGYYR